MTSAIVVPPEALSAILGSSPTKKDTKHKGGKKKVKKGRKKKRSAKKELKMLDRIAEYVDIIKKRELDSKSGVSSEERAAVLELLQTIKVETLSESICESLPLEKYIEVKERTEELQRYLDATPSSIIT